MSEAELADYFALAKEAVRNYVADERFPLPMSEQLEAYMARRSLEYTRYVVGSMARSIDTSFDWEIIDGKLLVMVGVRVDYSYGGPASDFVSSFGTGMQLLIENPQAPVLIDWFCPGKGSWDRYERNIPFRSKTGSAKSVISTCATPNIG